MPNLLAVDPALIKQGWALFDLRTGQLLTTGAIFIDAIAQTLEQRYAEVAKQASLAIAEQTTDCDLFTIESALMTNDPENKTSHIVEAKLSTVRGIWLAVATLSNLKLLPQVRPRDWQYHIKCPGQAKRNEVKAAARTFATRVYNLPPNETQDICDAVCVGDFALSRLRASALSLRE